MRILSLQPFYDGSHKAFMNGWMRHSEHDWTVLSLPGRHWKWRMRHSAVEFSRQLRSPEYTDQVFDAVFCSDMLNLAEFRGLAPADIAALKTVVYFHENQFEYPNRFSGERDLHFAFTNLTTALAADEVWFNSDFNRNTLLAGIQSQCDKWPDFAPRFAIEAINGKSAIHPPGIDIPDSAKSSPGPSSPLHLVWAARWEYDKNPADLLAALILVQERGTDFRLSVLGQSFRETPSEFESIRSRFSDQIVNWGYLESSSEYWKALQSGDVFISTADHEFFGIAAAEAIAAGLFPLLPNRLAYPELLGQLGVDSNRYVYESTATHLADRIEELSVNASRTWREFQSDQLARRCLRRFGWMQHAPSLDSAIQQATSADPKSSQRVNR